MLLARERSVCLGWVFVALDTARSCRRCSCALLREESCGRFFLIPCGRASINDQLKYTTGMNGLLTFVFLYWLDAGPYRLEGGGVRSRFILPLGSKRPKVIGG